MADDGFDSGPAPQLLLDLAVGAAPLAGAVDAQGLGRVVADIAVVNVGLLDLDPGQGLRFGYHDPKGVAVIRPVMKGLGMEHELASGRAGVGGEPKYLL